MPVCYNCSKAAVGCAFSAERCLVPVCSNCANSMTIWCMPNQFIVTAIAMQRELAEELVNDVHVQFIQTVRHLRDNHLEEASLYEWRKMVDRACDTLQEQVKRLLSEQAQLEGKYTEAALLPLVATAARPRVVNVVAAPVTKERFERAQEQSLERVREITGVRYAITLYDTPEFFAADPQDDESLLIVAGAARHTVAIHDNMSIDGLVAPGDVCAVSALMSSMEYRMHKHRFFALGTRDAQPSLALWNYTTQHLVTVTMPAASSDIRSASFSCMVTGGLLHICAEYEDSPPTYSTIPAAALYSRA